jgi:hypothetical protein
MVFISRTKFAGENIKKSKRFKQIFYIQFKFRKHKADRYAQLKNENQIKNCILCHYFLIVGKKYTELKNMNCRVRCNCNNLTVLHAARK